MFATGFAAGLYTIIPGGHDPTSAGSFTAIGIAQVTVAVPLLVWTHRRRPLRLPASHRALAQPMRDAAIIAAALSAIYLVAAVTSADTFAPVTAAAAVPLTSAPLLLVVTVFTGPLLEEVAFRRVLHSGLRQRFSMATSTVAGAVLFAAAHLPLTTLAPISWYLASSVAFTWLYERHGTVIAPIAAHAAVNAVACLAVIGR